MIQWKLTAPFTFVSEEIPKTEFTNEEVLLKVNSFGICGSDLQMYHGKHKYMKYPIVIGHEVSAVIEAVGSGAEGFKVGETVTVQPQIFCGECYPCSIGRFNVCQNLKVMGVHEDGFSREYVAVKPSFLRRCPSGIRHDWISLIEPLACGVGSVRRAGNYKGMKIAVVGAGTIGNFIAQSAKAMGASRVLIADVDASRLSRAERCGVDYTVNTTRFELKDAIHDAFGSGMADVIIDAAGVHSSMDSIIKAARCSSVIVVTGNFKEPYPMEIPLLQRQEISFIGHMMYVKEDFEDAIRFIENGSVKVDELITQRFPAEQLREAFKFIDDNPREVMKVVVNF